MGTELFRGSLADHGGSSICFRLGDRLHEYVRAGTGSPHAEPTPVPCGRLTSDHMLTRTLGRLRLATLTDANGKAERGSHVIEVRP